MRLFPFLLIPMILGAIFAAAKKDVAKAEKNMDENNFIMRQPKLFMWVGIVCMLVFGALIIYMSIFPNDTAEWWVFLGFFVFVLLGLLLVLVYIIWEIKIEGENIYCKFLLRRKNFSFSDITKVRIKNPNPQNDQYQQAILYAGTKKILTIESFCRGYSILIKRLKKENIHFIY